MNYYKYDIVFQEIPGEISLAFYITGCPLRCKGCHSPELWRAENGQPLTKNTLEALLARYHGGISCVLFLGGEWEMPSLLEMVRTGKEQELKTALYTGRELEDLPKELIAHLDYLKTGPWREELGGLDSPKTNQRFFYFNQTHNTNSYFTNSKEALCL